MKLTANQTVILLCIYRGFPNPGYLSTMPVERSDTFAGTASKDLDILLSHGLIGAAPPNAGMFGITSTGEAEVRRILGQPEPEVVDPAAVAAEEWLRTAKLGIVGFHGEHEEGGAAFRLGGIRISGPALHEFGQLSKEGISPYRVYSAFTTELIARWNRGQSEEDDE